jgi:hypothetical protein
MCHGGLLARQINKFSFIDMINPSIKGRFATRKAQFGSLFHAKQSGVQVQPAGRKVVVTNHTETDL